MNPDTFTVLITCPQPILQYALRTTFVGNGIDAVEVASTLEDGSRILAEHPVGMVLVDTQVLRPGKYGFQDVAALRTRFPELTIIVLIDNETVFFGEVLESIAHGAISKGDHPQALVDLCTWVRNGCYGFWISLMVAAVYLHRRMVTIKHQLTDRELHVLQLLDLSNREIATDLRLTVGTVKNYVSVIYDKLGVGSRAEALKVRGEVSVLYGSGRP